MADGGLGVLAPDLDRMREYRLSRLRAELKRLDCGGALLTDPLNIRYATDSTNMQVWCLHNAVRYAYVATEGPVVIFDFHSCEHLSNHLPLVTEARPATAWFYFESGPRIGELALSWAAEIGDLVTGHGGGNRRLAVDKVNPEGAAALAALGIEIVEGQQATELARAIKSPDELVAMHVALAACDAGMAAMRDALKPGITENALWALLHYHNIRLGGEWIETRLFSSGPRTNPWFHESSDRVIQRGEMVGLDTDLVGPYGYCADVSRSWVCDARSTGEQRDLHAMACEQIAFNMDLLKAGLSFREFGERAWRIPPNFAKNRYSVVAHGVGLCDEWPALRYPQEIAKFGYDGVFEENMTICVESYIGAEGGAEGVKLEQQVRITETGCELMSAFPMALD